MQDGLRAGSTGFKEQGIGDKGAARPFRTAQNQTREHDMGGKPRRKPLARAAQLGLRRRGFCANRATHNSAPGNYYFAQISYAAKGCCVIVSAAVHSA